MIKGTGIKMPARTYVVEMAFMELEIAPVFLSVLTDNRFYDTYARAYCLQSPAERRSTVASDLV